MQALIFLTADRNISLAERIPGSRLLVDITADAGGITHDKAAVLVRRPSGDNLLDERVGSAVLLDSKILLSSVPAYCASRITPQPIFSPEFPDGRVTKSSGMAWMMTERPKISLIWNRLS